MATPPHLVADGDELKLDVSLGRDGRQQFALSDCATALLVDDLGYGNRDVVPWLTTKTLALAGGAYRREEKTDARDLAWSITGAGGGAEADDAEVELLADYLRSVDVDEHAVETVREHVRETALSGILDPEAVSGKRDRVNGLRRIARDL